MNERFTPSEHAEVAIKVKQREKDRERAEFYHCFLDSLRSKVVGQLLREDLNRDLGEVDINTTKLPLSKFEFCNAKRIGEYIIQSMKDANEKASTSENITANAEELAKMTPMEFYRYIDDLKATLVKDSPKNVVSKISPEGEKKEN